MGILLKTPVADLGGAKDRLDKPKDAFDPSANTGLDSVLGAFRRTDYALVSGTVIRQIPGLGRLLTGI